MPAIDSRPGGKRHLPGRDASLCRERLRFRFDR